MKTAPHRSIEERLEVIELDVKEVKRLLLGLAVAKAHGEEKVGDEFMTVKELVNFAKVEAATIYAACAKNELKFIKIGKLYKFRKDDILEWMNSNHSSNGVNVEEYVDKYLQRHLLNG